MAGSGRVYILLPLCLKGCCSYLSAFLLNTFL
jgi:hypothetical protein